MLDQYGEKSRITLERTSTYRVSHSKKLRWDPDLFIPSFYTFLCLLVSSKAAQFKNSNRMQWQCHPGGSRDSQRNLQNAAPKQDDEEDDELNVQQEWDLTFHEMPESDDDDDDDDDDNNNNDVESLREDFANIEEANKLLEAQTAIAQTMKPQFAA